MRIDGSPNPYVRNDPAQPAPAAHAPARASAALRDVLTSEERDYFAQLEQLGPLTYGRRPSASQPAIDAPRGQRIDVKA